MYFAIHDSEEDSANNLLVVHLKPALRLRNLARPFQFGEMVIKGRAAKGNIVTKHSVDRVVRAPKDMGGETDFALE